MRRRDVLAGLVAGGAVGPAWAGTGREDRAQATALAAALAGSWPIRYANLAAHPEYGLSAWVSLLRERDARAALGSGHGGALARAHAELAASYRLAAIATAHALLSVFDTQRASTDPVGSLHLVAVSRAILGDRAAARAAAAQVTPDPAIDPWHAPWRAWLATDAPFPPTLALPVALPPPTPRGSPEVGPLPHYTLPLAPPADDLARPFGDPGLLVALASWHEAAARAVPEVEAGQLDGWFALYAWPGAPTGAVPALAEFCVYGGPVLAAADGSFLGALAAEGPGAVDTWADRSPLAWLARSARVDGVVEAGAADAVTRRAAAHLESAAEDAAGRWEGYHSLFADLAAGAVLRGLARVAAAEGQPEVEGALLLASLEGRWIRVTAPSGVLRQVVYDCAHENGGRAAGLAWPLVEADPTLGVLRAALDALQLRASFGSR